MFAILQKVEPAEHVDRWYLVTVQPTLLDPMAVICAWGSRQNEWQQWRIFPAGSWEEANALAQKIVARRLKRGYYLVAE
jgi:hypothetical protein